jgi:fucose permease
MREVAQVAPAGGPHDGTGRPRVDRLRLSLAFAAFALIGVAAGGAGVLLPAQITDYGVDKSTIGLMFVTFSVGYVAAAAANGALLHRFGVRAYVVVGAGVVCAGAVLSGLRPPFVVLVALQLAIGFGGGALDAALNAYVSTLAGSTALLNYLHAFFGVGALIGPLLAAALLDANLAWPVFYLWYAALAAALGVGLLLWFPRVTAAAVPEAKPRLGMALQTRVVWLAALFLAVYVGIEISVGNWGFSFLTEERHQDVLMAGWVVSGYWLGLTLGRFVLYGVAQRAGLGVVGLMLGCLAGIVACAFVIWLVPSSVAASAGLFLLGFVLGPVFPTVIAVVPRLVPGSLVATAIGILVGISVGVGALFPWVVGALAQRLGTWSLLPATIGLAVVLAVLWRWIVRRLAHPAPSP